MLRVVRKEVRHKIISEASYYRVEKRCLQYGDSMEDWLIAEAEVEQNMLNSFLYSPNAPR